MNYLQFTFTTNADELLRQTCLEVLSQMLADIGFDAFEEQEEELKAYIQEERFSQAELDRLMNDFPIPAATFSYTSQHMADQNWNKVWEDEGFSPIIINNKLIVYDAKHVQPDVFHTSDYEYAIGIDACQAFGTGTHQTTQLMLELLMQCQTSDCIVADAGCGSGILGIAASMLGAQRVVAFDIDPWSVENTRHNAKLNNTENIEAILSDGSCLNDYTDAFNIVMANINRNILINMMPLLVGSLKNGGNLLVSGFYTDDIEKLLLAASAFELKLLEKKSKGEWCALHFRR